MEKELQVTIATKYIYFVGWCARIALSQFLKLNITTFERWKHIFASDLTSHFLNKQRRGAKAWYIEEHGNACLDE